EADRLEPPIFTPATKAELGDHDENVSLAQIAETVGTETAEKLRELTIDIYQRAEAIARERGIILADTQFEFGTLTDGTIVLGDEVLTPDSSRFWAAEDYAPGRTQASFDKQLVRDWLTTESGWDKSSDPPPPALPAEVVDKTRARYIEAFERLTGQTFPGSALRRQRIPAKWPTSLPTSCATACRVRRDAAPPFHTAPRYPAHPTTPREYRRP